MLGVDYKAGDVVVQECGGTTRYVLVTELRRPVKNGLPGFYGTVVTESGEPLSSCDWPEVWGYDYEVVRVIRAA